MKVVQRSRKVSVQDQKQDFGCFCACEGKKEVLLLLTVLPPNQSCCWQSQRREADSTLHLPHPPPVTRQHAT